MAIRRQVASQELTVETSIRAVVGGSVGLALDNHLRFAHGEGRQPKTESYKCQRAASEQAKNWQGGSEQTWNRMSQRKLTFLTVLCFGRTIYTPFTPDMGRSWGFYEFPKQKAGMVPADSTLDESGGRRPGRDRFDFVAVCAATADSRPRR